jgi:heparanase 1
VSPALAAVLHAQPVTFDPATLPKLGTVDAGPSPAPGVDLFAHCLAGTRGGVGLVAVNTDRTEARDLSIGTKWDRYTLTASSGLQSRTIELNGTPLVLAKESTVPVLRGVSSETGRLTLPPASITFVALPGATNPNCR